MSPDDPRKLFLEIQESLLSNDLTCLIKLLQSPEIPEEYSAVLKSRLELKLENLKDQMPSIRARMQALDYPGAWALVDQIRKDSLRYQETAMSFFGGMEMRKTGIDRGMAEAAQRLLKDYSVSIGIDWTPIVIPGEIKDFPINASEAEVIQPNPGDSLVCIPVLNCDYWHIPLTVRSLGYWVAKTQPESKLRNFFDQEIQRVQRILTDVPPSAEEITACLPEIIEVLEDRLSAVSFEEFISQRQARLETLLIRQKIHFLQLAGDAFATMLMGPAYVYALLFLEADPIHPLAEGEAIEQGDEKRSRYRPCDVRRLAVCLRTLHHMNEAAKKNEYEPGRLTPDLKRLQMMWESALSACGNQKVSQFCNQPPPDWVDRLAVACINQYGNLSKQTVESWDRIHQELEPLLIKTGGKLTKAYDLITVVNACWWYRARYPDLVEKITQGGWRLLEGDGKINGIGADKPRDGVDAKTLLSSRCYDLAAEVKAVQDIFRSNKIISVYHDSAAGHFYRMLSVQDLTLENIERGIQKGNPVDPSFNLLAEVNRGNAQEIRLELLDFLGGISMRELDLVDKACKLADRLVREIAQRAGVNWASAVIPGKHPLFSPAVEIIYLRFPDWDIWNLPLMVHELGHVMAFTSPQFTELLAEQQFNITQPPPASAAWTQDQVDKYSKKRIRHFHELFADAFAVYSLGPAYALCAILLNFDARHAFDDRGDHPSHGERVLALLRILENMNKKDAEEKNQGSPYVGTVKFMKESWLQAVASYGKVQGDLSKFHDIKTTALVDTIIFPFLHRYFRLGIQYKAENWLQALDASEKLVNVILKKTAGSTDDLYGKSLPDLLNIAWICKSRYPEYSDDIARVVWEACEE